MPSRPPLPLLTPCNGAAAATVQRLLHVSEALARAATPDAVLQVALEQGLEALGAHAGVVVLRPPAGGQLEVRARRALDTALGAAVLALEDRLPLASPRPMCVAARTGQPVWMQAEEFYDCTGTSPCHPGDTVAGLPLESQGEVLGALGLWLPAEVGAHEALRGLAQLLAQLCGQALRRAQLEEAERAAREEAGREHARAAMLADALPHHVWTGDASGRVDAVNAWTLRYSGLSRQRALDECLGRLFHPEDAPAVAAVAQPAQARGEPYEVEARLQRVSDGQWRWHLIRASPVRDAQGRCHTWVGAAVDIHERKALEEERAALLVRESQARRQVEAARLAAEEANQLKDEFLARVSHELATPLFAMRMWLEVLGGPAPGRRRAALDALAQCVRAQGKLVEDLLDVSRAVTGKLRLQHQRVHLEEVVGRAVALAQPQARARGLTLTLHSRAAGLAVEGDAARLEQVAGNLLSNALKFTPPGGRVEVTLAPEEGGRVGLQVQDSGRGMAADFLPHLFSPFRQEEGASTRQQGGLGLGLSITRSLVEAHGGLIRAHSAGPGQGSTFHVTLPQAAPCPAPLLPVRLPEGRGAALLEGVHLLLVEDDALSRAALCRVLRRHGARVQAVTSVGAALGALGRRRPDVLVSDLALPGEDGFSLVRQVRARPELGGRALPVLALSARARAEDRARALEAGFDAHLGKPAEPDALVALLCRLAERRAAHLG